MKILIGADFVPTDSNVELFSAGKTEELVGSDLSQVLKDANTYCIFNLEVPLCDVTEPIPKCGPNLIAPTSTIAGYKSLGVDLLTLANNHILDQGDQGLDSTRKILDQSGIHYLGAGANLAEAARPHFFCFAEKKIGVYACAEHEFTIASENTAGANPFDPLESLDHVEQVKKQCDYVIVLYHGGKEHYRYPSPNLQKVCRKLIDKGANLVVCQHSHCIGCREEYHDGTIVYGQGNFLFDDGDNEFWNTSLLIQVDEEMKVSYIPLTKVGNTVRLASSEKIPKILDGFYTRSAEIKSPGVIEAKYADFANNYLNTYLYRLSGKKNLVFRILDKLSGRRLIKWYFRRTYQYQNLLAIRNTIECEAHRELLLYGIQNNHKE